MDPEVLLVAELCGQAHTLQEQSPAERTRAPRQKGAQSGCWILQHHLNGISFKGSVDSLVKKTAGLSFAQIEQLLIESIKSMILEDRKQLTTEQVTLELEYMQKMMAATNRERMALDE